MSGRARSKSKGRRGRKKSTSSVRIKVRSPGSLTSLGYRMDKPVKNRRAALSKAVKKYGYSLTMRKVNALSVWNKRRPKLERVANLDKRWLKCKYGNKSRSRSRSRRKRSR